MHCIRCLSLQCRVNSKIQNLNCLVHYFNCCSSSRLISARFIYTQLPLWLPFLEIETNCPKHPKTISCCINPWMNVLQFIVAFTVCLQFFVQCMDGCLPFYGRIVYTEVCWGFVWLTMASSPQQFYIYFFPAKILCTLTS